ncbi:MAG: YcaO-like family protein [Desulfobacteraceae bacterium]|nr:YcaO-like family protein [Desulfobacteraceae bacterium]
MTHKIILNDAFKRFTLDQDKILPPEETIRRFKEKLKKVDLDILEEIIRIDNGRLDIPIYFSSCGRDALAVIGTKKQMGKGATPLQAEASAVMELAERFSFFSFCKNSDNFFVDTYRNLRNRAIPFEMIAQSVHDDSEDLDASKKVFENIPLKWTKAFNLTLNQEVLIPFNWFYTINEFNGPSAGNCIEEALLQGICEIVERHVSSVVNHNQLKVPAVNPDSATDPMVVEMIKKYRRAGIKLYLSDFSLDTGIPSVGVLAYDPANFPEKSEIVWTAGTTPDPEKALSRALTEVAQLAGDFNTSSNYVASGLPKFSSIDQADFIINPGKQVDIGSLPQLADDNIKVEIQNCLSALANKNMEVIVVNTMHPLLEIPAFYTIIPGAHFRERALGTSVGMFSAKLITENQNPADAIGELEKIEKIIPGKYYIKFYLGYCHLALNNSETALEHFTRALDMHPTQEDIVSIYSYMGVCLKDMGKYRKALALLKKAESYDRERTDIYNLMGFSHFKLKEHEKAIACFKKVLQLNPSSAIDYANIGSNYREMGDKEKAVRYYEMALALDPGIEFAQDNLGKLLS